MMRKERKERREVRREDILAEVSEVAAEFVRNGGTSRDAILEADKWLLGKIKVHPQEAQLYRDVAADYSRRIRELVKERE